MPLLCPLTLLNLYQILTFCRIKLWFSGNLLKEKMHSENCVLRYKRGSSPKFVFTIYFYRHISYRCKFCVEFSEIITRPAHRIIVTKFTFPTICVSPLQYLVSHSLWDLLKCQKESLLYSKSFLRSVSLGSSLKGEKLSKFHLGASLLCDGPEWISIPGLG